MGGSLSGRSISAMLTSVAMASMEVGGRPTTCSPQGSSRDSISISLRKQVKKLYQCRGVHQEQTHLALYRA